MHLPGYTLMNTRAENGGYGCSLVAGDTLVGMLAAGNTGVCSECERTLVVEKHRCLQWI